MLCYHAVSERWADRLAVPLRELERQLQSLLRRGFRPVGAEAVASAVGSALHVTFDDAYANVAAALPLLERLGIPASVYACPDYADGGAPLDVPELAAEAAAHPDELRTMTWDELRGLVERGVVVGSHTLSHAHLTHVDDAQLDRELRESRARLEDGLGVPCRYLAYPYGEQDARVRVAARRAGYEAAFALPGSARPLDVFALPRVGIYRADGVARFALKTALAHGPAETLLAARRRLVPAKPRAAA